MIIIIMKCNTEKLTPFDDSVYVSKFITQMYIHIITCSTNKQKYFQWLC